jgi:predicted O-methyltransferase YrrM
MKIWLRIRIGFLTVPSMTSYLPEDVGNALEIIPKLNQKFQLMFLDAAKVEYLKYLKSAEKSALKKVQ